MNQKFHIIGNMTGNSMDAIDILLTEFDGDKMTDICAYSVPYSKDMQQKIHFLRSQVRGKKYDEILAIPHFDHICCEYVTQVAQAINKMLSDNHIDKKLVDAIGFHGKTLDHNPPSVAQQNGTLPYTLQIGSGQMLADLTDIKVIYDFRSAYIQNGFDGAPLVPPHNAHVAQTEGDGCYYNAGNTSNFAIVTNGVAKIGADAAWSNASKETIVGWGMPDYSAGVTISSGYEAINSGFIRFTTASGAGGSSMSINGVEIQKTGSGGNYYTCLENTIWPVKKGDIITFNSGAAKFYLVNGV